MNFSPAINEETDLAVERAGKKSHPARQLDSNNAGRRNIFALQAFYLFSLGGIEPRSIAANFIDKTILVFSMSVKPITPAIK